MTKPKKMRGVNGVVEVLKFDGTMKSAEQIVEFSKTEEDSNPTAYIKKARNKQELQGLFVKTPSGDRPIEEGYYIVKQETLMPPESLTMEETDMMDYTSVYSYFVYSEVSLKKQFNMPVRKPKAKTSSPSKAKKPNKAKGDKK